MALDRKQDSVIETLVGVLDEVGAAFSSASDLEKAIWAATTMDPHPASRRDLAQISAATHNPKNCQLVCATLAARMRDDHWRFVSKSLKVCEYCLENGDARFEYEMKKHMGTLRKLLSYKYIDDDGNDRGFQVRKEAKKFLQMLESGGRDDDDFGGGYGGARGSYGDLDFDEGPGPRGGAGRRSPPMRGGGGGGRVMKPDYEKEGTGLFSDDEEDDDRGRLDEDSPRGDRGRARVRRVSGGDDKSLSPVRRTKDKDASPPRRHTAKSPPRRQTSSSKAAHSASKDAGLARKSTGSGRRADTSELASKLDAFSMADSSKPAAAPAGGVRAVTPTQNLLDDLDDDFGDFSAGPTAAAPAAFGAASAPLQPAAFAASAPRPSGMGAPLATAAPRPAAPVVPAAAAAGLYRTVSPQGAPAAIRPSAAPLQPQPMRPPAAAPMPQQPRPGAQQQQQKPVAGSGLNSLVNLDAHSLSKLGGQKRPEAPKKSAPLASLSSSSSSGWKS